MQNLDNRGARSALLSGFATSPSCAVLKGSQCVRCMMQTTEPITQRQPAHLRLAGACISMCSSVLLLCGMVESQNV